jgi:hypothetical protein
MTNIISIIEKKERKEKKRNINFDFLNNINKEINNIQGFMNNILNKIQKSKYMRSKSNKYIKPRKSPITFNILFYFLCSKIGNCQNYVTALKEYKCNINTSLLNILNIENTIFTSSIYDKTMTYCKSSFIQKKDKINSEIFRNINQALIKFLYKDQLNIVAVDGSYLTFDNCNKLDLRVHKSGDYKYSKLSALYDINKNIPIDLSINKKTNERSLLLSQVDFLKKYDIVITDRGYFSVNLYLELMEKSIYGIFRLGENLNVIKDYFLKKNNGKNKKRYTKNRNNKDDIIRTIIMNNKEFKIRLIRYKIDNKEYYIGTSIFNKKYDVEWFKNLYHKRWDVETHFRTLKTTLSICSKGKTLNSIQQDVYINQFICIINGYIASLLTKEINTVKYKINLINSINLSIKIVIPYIANGNLLYISPFLLIYSLIQIIDTLTVIENERSFKIITKKPSINKTYKT